MEPGPDGSTLELKRVDQREEKAVTKIQAAFRRYKARELYQSLQTLQQMNLEVKWPDGYPFIGLLIVKVNYIKNLSGVRHALLRAKFDGDQSINVYGFKDKDHIIQFDYRATFVNIALKSNSVLTIEAVQGLDVAIRALGKVTVPISTLDQGVNTLDWSLRSSGKEVGVMNVTIGYQWLRGTADYGGYNGPDLLVIPSRKLRGSTPGQAVERLWQVNHWVCSHDNVWSTSPKFGDIVMEAVRRDRTKGMSLEGMDIDGETTVINPAEASNVFKTVNSDQNKQMFTSVELIQQVLGTTDVNFLPTVDSLMSISSSTVNSTYGKEDWRRALEELNSLSISGQETQTGASIEEEEEEGENYDLTETPTDLKELDSTEDSDSDTPEVSEETQNTSSSPIGQDTSSSSNKVCSLSGRVHAALTKNCQKKKKRVKPTAPVVSGKFEYGVYRPASERGVHIFLRRYGNTSNSGDIEVRPIYIGSHQTSKHGRVEVPVPNHVAPIAGLYHVMALLPDDNTFGHGTLYLLEKGTKCVVFDLDGTITTSDVHVVAQTLLDSVSASTVIGSSLAKNYDLRARANALTCVRAWAAKGYQVVYLSGRQGSAYNMTLEWLIKHGYPPGPIHLTRTHLPTLPVYVSVGHFKIQYMKELMDKGFEIYAAYGNTGTDIKAYDAVGIPKQRTFIVGSNGGKKGTVAVKDFTSHLLDVLKHPDADKPLPYTELLMSTPSQKTGFLE
eukprot:g2949.t1